MQVRTNLARAFGAVTRGFGILASNLCCIQALRYVAIFLSSHEGNCWSVSPSRVTSLHQ
jgi:hypothetical protein